MAHYTFAYKARAVLGLPINYPDNGGFIVLAEAFHSKYIESEYQRRFSLNAMFKEAYADTLQNLIPVSNPFLKLIPLSTQGNLYHQPVVLKLPKQKKKK